jgi:hypothetical protein
LLDHVNDVLAVLLKLSLDLLLVLAKGASELGVFRILLDSGNRSNGSALTTDEVLKSNREEVALLNREVAALVAENGSEEVDHVVEALSLLSHAGHEDLFLHRYLEI